MEVAFNDSVVFEKYFRGPMVCFSHAGNPPEGYNLSADISQIYLTSVMKTSIWPRSKLEEGGIFTRWGDKKDSHTGPLNCQHLGHDSQKTLSS